VQPEQPQAIRVGQHLARGLEGHAAGERKAELLVLMTGRDELVRVGLDADRHADHDGRDDIEFPREGDDPVDLVKRVDDDASHAIGECGTQLGDRLVVAVESDPLPRETNPLGHRQLATGADIEEEPFLHHPPGDCRAQEGLACVVHVSASTGVGERRGILLLESPCTRTEVVFVEHVCRGAEVPLECEDVDSGHLQDAIAPTVDVACPERGHELHDVRRRREIDGRPTVTGGVKDACLV
jgi:hypothetical protein